MVQKMKELLLFQVGALQLGMDLSFVMSIQDAPHMVSKPAEKHPRFAPLTLDHDIPVYDLSAILGDENASGDSENEKLIVVHTQDRPMGLIVGHAHRVVKADIDRIEPLSTIFHGPALSCFPRVLKHEGKLVLLMSPQGMVNIARQMQPCQVFRQESDSKNQDERPSGVKSADTVIAEMILQSRQNMMNQSPI
jgi:CheW-like domain